MKKQAFLVAAALLVIGAAGCSTAPVAQESQPAVAEVPPTVDTVSDTTSAPVADAAPVVEDTPAQDATPSSLGASSSGRGH